MVKHKVTNLLEGIKYKQFGNNVDAVSGLTDDSRKVEPGFLFVAVKGLTLDGHKFIDRAIVQGSKVVVGEAEPKNDWFKQITYIKVDNSRNTLGRIASNWFDNPSKKLVVIGVTGTDGKTTTASMIYHILNSCGRKTGLISTVSARIGKKEFDTGSHVTNPNPLELQRYLTKMVEEKCRYAVVEVTSHGLDQERISGIEFDTAVLTNITNEHLDYHKCFESYRDTKARLFKLAKRTVVLNKDDASFDRISTIVANSSKLISYSLKDNSADYSANIIKEDDSGLKIDFNVPGRSVRISIPIIGEFNVANTLAAFAACA